MPRPPRHHLPGAIYHVILKGNNGQSVFLFDTDRIKFCILMQEGLERYGHSILAFCFMTNHVHLAIQVDEIPLSKILQNLSFRYTQFFNREHERIGHLFQGRFKSVLVDSERYLMVLIRYIHLNPVQAEMVNSPEQYRWSSHRAYLLQVQIGWLNTKSILYRFGGANSEARKAFHKYVLAGIGRVNDVDFDVGCENGILGDENFIEKIKEHSQIQNDKPHTTISLQALLSAVIKKYAINIEELAKPGIDRRYAHIRSVMAFLTRNANGVNLRELAQVLGRKESSMSKAAARLELKLQRSEALRIEVREITDKIATV